MQLVIIIKLDLSLPALTHFVNYYTLLHDTHRWITSIVVNCKHFDFQQEYIAIFYITMSLLKHH
jgi:hypothetical protein